MSRNLTRLDAVDDKLGQALLGIASIDRGVASLGQNLAELSKCKAHESQLRTLQPGLLGHGLQHLAQVGNPAFHSVCQRVTSLESKRCPPALAGVLQISHALASLGAFEGLDRFRAHIPRVAYITFP